MRRNPFSRPHLWSPRSPEAADSRRPDAPTRRFAGASECIEIDPLSSTASMAAASPNCTKRSEVPRFLRREVLRGLETLHLRGEVDGNSCVIEPRDGPEPVPCTENPFQKASRPMPIGVTAPSPVMTRVVDHDVTCPYRRVSRLSPRNAHDGNRVVRGRLKPYPLPFFLMYPMASPTVRIFSASSSGMLMSNSSSSSMTSSTMSRSQPQVVDEARLGLHLVLLDVELGANDRANLFRNVVVSHSFFAPEIL